MTTRMGFLLEDWMSIEEKVKQALPNDRNQRAITEHY
jgi:hypothetical protein